MMQFYVKHKLFIQVYSHLYFIVVVKLLFANIFSTEFSYKIGIWICNSQRPLLDCATENALDSEIFILLSLPI